MKKGLFAIAAIAALTGSQALAADLPLKEPPPPVPTWTGCYVDGGVGYGLWNQDHNTTFPAIGGFTSTVTTTDGGRGWLGRAGGGCDYQPAFFNSRIVVGLFADYDFMGLNGTNSPNEVFAFPGPIGTTPITANEKETGAWYAGARIGFLLTPTILSFFDGGYTQTRFTQSGEFSTLTGAPIGFGYPNFTAGGWFLGGGFESSLAPAFAFIGMPALPGLFLRTEYRFSEYQTQNLTEVALGTGLPTGNIEHTSPYVQTVTTSLVWRFMWPASFAVH